MSDKSESSSPSWGNSEDENNAYIEKLVKNHKQWLAYVEKGQTPFDVPMFDIWDRVLPGLDRAQQLEKWNECTEGWLTIEQWAPHKLNPVQASAVTRKFRMWCNLQIQPRNLRELLTEFDKEGMRRKPADVLALFNDVLGASGGGSYRLHRRDVVMVTAEDVRCWQVHGKAAANAISAKNKTRERTCREKRMKNLSKKSPANKPDTTKNRPKRKP